MYKFALFVMMLAGAVVLMILCASVLFKYRSMKKRENRIIGELEGKKKVYELIPQKSSQLSMVVNAERKIAQYISDNVYDIFGMSQETVLADVFALKSSVSSEDVRGFEDDFEKWDKKSMLERDFEYRHIGNGESKVGKLQLTFNAEDNTYLIMISDITLETLEKRKTEKELASMKRMNAYRNEFLASLSHEVRTPINSMLGTLQLTQAHSSESELVEKYAANVAEQTKFLLSLLDDMFDISKLETGAIEIESTKFDILAVADKLRTMFTETTKNNGIDLKIETSDFQVRYLMGDELRLVQILMSFISRAQDISKKCKNILISMRQMNNASDKVNVMFRIKDDGIKLTNEEMNSMFTPFEAENAGNFALAVSQQLINMMGGQIIMNSDSVENDFTVFITFPLADCEQDMSAPIESETAVNENFTYEGCRVLLAEDNETNAEIAKELLEMQGASVDIASNGVEAIEMYKNGGNEKYDTILMDIQMPEMDGWEATRRIRAMDSKGAKTIPIFALSANVFAEDRKRSVEAGMNGHITKPIDFEELRKELAKYL